MSRREPDPAPEDGRVAHAFTRLLIRSRWAVIGGWLVAVALALLLLPGSGGGGGGFGGLVPEESAAVRVLELELAEFRFPLSSATLVVTRDPKGLSVFTQADTALRALAVDQELLRREPPYPRDEVLGALPVVNTGGVFPATNEQGTTAATYLFFNPASSLEQRTAAAEAYAEHFRRVGTAPVWVTGPAPARVAQVGYITDRLPLVEAATFALIAIIVGFTFRSVVMPAVTLGTAVVGYLLASRLLALLATHTDLGLPQEAGPLVVALLLGVVTDYCVLFGAEYRDQLREGRPAEDAARQAIQRTAPIVAAAGLTVAGGTAALAAAKLAAFRSFGPGLTLTVVVGLAVAVTLLPAVLTTLGPRLFWPSHPGPAGRHAVPGGGGLRLRLRLLRPLLHRRSAALVAVLVAAPLVLAALPLAGLRLDASFISGLPATDPAARGAQAVNQGFAGGLLGPTTVLVRAPGIGAQNAGLRRLQQSIAAQPGVAGVLGPASLPLPEGAQVFVSTSGRLARFTVYFATGPLGATAIANLRELQADLPALAREAGLPAAEVLVGGSTAIAAESAQATRDNLQRIGLAALLVEFLILAVFLRALVAPLFLLACSVLVVAAALGLTSWVFTDVLGHEGVTFYVPFAASVLLLALGSDYNVFVVGRIWEQARRDPLGRATVLAVARSSRAVTIAGLVLAGSFGLLALIPLASFRELAFMMAAGLLLDTLVVRTLLTPALVTLVGVRSGWPGRRLRHPTPVIQGGSYRPQPAQIALDHR